ncbi:Na+/proline symporter [Pustulibacterium marinum]|uniref:histidine kinase n=1 Tax=Pustulibacterium marinum TaxID=1224947 RepID=A0A1I7IC49_9FLAO|nr:sensor histidine kinase [Pustulibacterium marinum]SFU70370.1 Na+/proline symporter [Pustulibacterium marinum]
MSNYILICIIICYLVMLFLIAFWAEKNATSKWVNNPVVYTLSLGVFCSAWTYYGSIGVAADEGASFLSTYLGPVIAAPLWIVVLRKIMRISKHQKISSIADFMALRYGNNRFIGALVTITCLIAIVPYISLQLKAVSETFEILSLGAVPQKTSFQWITFYVAVLLAIFAAFFGTQTTDTTDKHIGIVATVAFESILKLVFFLVVGVYVTYFLFDGTSDIYNQFSKVGNIEKLSTFPDIYGGFNWFYMIVISFVAVFLLPRQFQMMVVENDRERYLKYAIWMFPLYLLLFNIFVIFIAWGGNLSFEDFVNPEYYTLLLPIKNGNKVLSLLVFLGGFSAVISMVVVATLALATMLSNNIIIPYGYLDYFRERGTEKNNKLIKNIRRFSIFMLIMGAYVFYINFSRELSLFSIGYISFVLIAQLAPSFFIGLYWNRGAARGAIAGIIVGVFITCYSLVLPFTLEAILHNSNFTDFGPFGIKLLKPHELFGLDFLNPISHAFFWSMFFNLITYLSMSLIGKGNYRERNYAEMFVRSQNYGHLQEGAYVWRGVAYISDIKKILERFLGNRKTEEVLDSFFVKYNIPKDAVMADAKLINFSERLLTGSLGSASAKILISSVVKEEPVSLPEVLQILEESKETISRNKFLREKSDQLTKLTAELKSANEELIFQDKQKDEFLDTVAHELKTPITAIKASAEIVLDDEEMPDAIRAQFLNNIVEDSERLSRLIHNILDIEKLASGREKVEKADTDIAHVIDEAVHLVMGEVLLKKITINNRVDSQVISVDEDRIVQVFTNLLSNAIKFVEESTGKIDIFSEHTSEHLIICVIDNGKGIPDEDFNYIFDKFYQSKHQNTKKPQGSGFGLAICKHIVESHGGTIKAIKPIEKGAKFVVKLPK